MVQENQKQHIIIAAGGTGGHIFPAIATCEALKKAGCTVSWLGTRHGLETDIVPKHGIEIDYIEISGIRKKSLLNLIKVLAQLFSAVWHAMGIIRRRQAVLVLGMGGYVAGPVGIAAKLTGTPLVIHEQNAIAGFTNKILAKISRKVMTSFPNTFPARYRPIQTGNPVRASLVHVGSVSERVENTRELRILVFGGSQGASVFHQVIPQALVQLPFDIKPEVIHQSGKRFIEQAQQQYKNTQIDVKLTPFIDDMASAYGFADLVIARAGALTVAELAAAGVGAILVPFPHAVDDHQTENSRFLADNGAAILVQEQDFTPAWLAITLKRLARNRQELVDMAQAAKSLGKADAADLVANQCLEVCRGTVV